MHMEITRQLAAELKLRLEQVERTVALLDEGNTIPFIARYRKEATGELDEVQLRSLAERLGYLRSLQSRREEVVRLIEAQGKLTPEISAAVEAAVTLQELEDLYRPFRPKRRTRASIAKEKGLEPLADLLLAQGRDDPRQLAEGFLTDDVPSIEDALQGAQDILAELFADDPRQRALLRKFTFDAGILAVERSDKEDAPEAEEFQMYFAYREPVAKIPPHRILAINRGERLGALKVKIEVDAERVHTLLCRQVITNGSSPAAPYLRAAIEDGYARLSAPSVEREIRNALTETAEKHAIQIFAKNLQNLLMQSPVRGRRVLGIDPGFRTGCKVAVVDEFGQLLECKAIYPHEPQGRWQEALRLLASLVSKHGVTLITIGNGTACRETEKLAAELVKEYCPAVQYLVVSEAGASVYSASELAREEFPELDVSMRGAVSIARRVQDPLAELVKIEPKSLGVGQYQHDVNQKELSDALDTVVESCVNHVGVNLNTASSALLRYVSGLSTKSAHEIVNHRTANGPFKRREELKKVKGIGPKTFEQAAGFLRIAEGTEPLDNTAVHPESYPLAREILAACGFSPDGLQSREALSQLRAKLRELDPERVASSLGAGVPTVRDIIASLSQPGRDPRDELPPPLFRADVLSMEDLSPGMVLKGTVQNVVDFGAFVDIGVKKAGLVHISQLSDEYVRHPTDVVQVGDIVTVRVLSVDPKLGRISLSMKIEKA
ncbi:MAG TPA: RNA-binding transcriptional accessory protein [Firmicutes bacterium]|jgi:uncharacterized protein|nr:RNA-binding transcriptional accessory protein [Bacillota bacterium]